MKLEDQVLTSEERHNVATGIALRTGFTCSYVLIVASVANATYSHLSGGETFLKYSNAGAVAAAFLAIGGCTLAGYLCGRFSRK